MIPMLTALILKAASSVPVILDTVEMAPLGRARVQTSTPIIYSSHQFFLHLNTAILIVMSHYCDSNYFICIFEKPLF